MAPRTEKSQLKRALPSAGDKQELKKPRRSQRLSSQSQPETAVLKAKSYLPSPLTHKESTTTDEWKEGTITPPEGRPSQIRHRTPVSSPPIQSLSSPPQDTQAFSQTVNADSISRVLEDEAIEGVWGYFVPLDSKFGGTIPLKKRTACPRPPVKSNARKATPRRDQDPTGGSQTAEEEPSEEGKESCIPAGGYLIGRHPECDRVIDLPTISNRHCLLFAENSHGETIAVLEDLSSNGTFVNEGIVGRNKRRKLEDGDEVTILDEARFTFRYPKNRDVNRFHQRYTLLQRLGKGHFATVHLCVEKATGQRFAVKIFAKRPGTDERSKTDGLQQEVAVLMSVSHSSMLCLKDAFDEDDGVYLVLELAPEGELFNWIILKSKLSEEETRRVFVQLFEGIKYLHERNIVHRDIKPENILLVDKYLTIKIADFGLAKIIGEESFTATLCGTPSYVAPEILEDSNHRKYTRAVDVWSLGVVLYICLCGFPPFSDELNTPDNPYTLSQQIKLGRFDYPSPYWDSVGDPALDLIDRMLTVDVESRISIDECLEHPWITQKPLGLNDSTEGLTGAMGQLDFSKRKVQRERTLLSNINDIKISKVIDIEPERTPVKVFEKNHDKKAPKSSTRAVKKADAGLPKKEATPAAQRDTKEFMELGGKGDQPLFADDAGSTYTAVDTKKAND
ncbi:MAG: hypothetical protein M1837_000674 [Sclerophora amabilis]|nr:MAG: hypothetical protein M1837_000674 [Sclerophora amabilis]